MCRRLPWLIAVLIVAASAFVLLQWRSERQSLEAALARVPAAIQPLGRHVEAAALRLRSLSDATEACRKAIEGLRRDVGELARRIESTPLAKTSSLESVNSQPSGEALPGDAEEETRKDANSEPLLPVERKYRAHVLLDKSLDELLADTEINPEKRTLGRVDYSRAGVVMAEAKSRIGMLTSEIEFELASGMERLRGQGEYVEYLRTDPPPVSEDRRVLSVAEPGEGGLMRLYWLFPEEFPAIYSKRRERDDASRRAIRELMAIIRNE